MNKLVTNIIKVLSAVFLSAALVGAGLFVCCAPPATSVLSSLFSNAEDSVFTHEELVKAAKATRTYTVSNNDKTPLYRVLFEINIKSQEAGRAVLDDAPYFPENRASFTTDELQAFFLFSNDSYVLTSEAISHLDDVYKVVSVAKVVLIVLTLLGIGGCIFLGIKEGRRALGLTITAAAIIVLVLFALVAAWAAISFQTFFTFLHSLFFADGTWTFSAESLLIRMYPTNFWIGMGVIWLATTVLACIFALTLGRLIKGRKQTS